MRGARAASTSAPSRWAARSSSRSPRRARQVFFFANYSMSNDSAPGRLAGTSTVPANRKHLEGDFSDLLLLPSGAGPPRRRATIDAQIFDPLTTAGSASSGPRHSRPVPEQHHPEKPVHEPGRLVESGVRALRAMVPAPNQNFLSPTQQPVNNYYRAAEPDQPHNMQGSVRLDYNHSASSRFFLRFNGNTFEESSLVDWTYDSPDPEFRGCTTSPCSLQLVGHGHLDEGAEQYTVIDTQISEPRPSARHAQEPGQLPADVGGPAGVPGRFLQARFECILPQVTFAAPAGTRTIRAWEASSTAASGSRPIRGSRT